MQEVRVAELLAALSLTTALAGASRSRRVADLLAGCGVVGARVIIGVAYPSGARFRDEEMHLWRFDADGLVSGMRHYADTAKHLAAWQGE